MKKSIILTAVLALLVFDFGYSQTEIGTYLNIDYLKVDASNYEAFEEQVNTQWKDLYENEIQNGKVNSWYFYRVTYPGGEASDYNYIVLSTYKNPEQVIVVNDKLRKYIINLENEKNQKLARHQYSELWKTEAGIVDTTDENLSPFLVMNYMMVKQGKRAEYMALENDMARPLHEERIRKGEMHSWSAYSLLKPGGLDYKYNFATADYFDNLENIEFGFTNELIKSVMPETDINEMFDAIYATRDIVKSELWQLIDASR